MKLDEGDALVNVHTCTEADDVLIATRGGMCIRFPVPDVRVFSGRTSTGVRGIRLAKGDAVISMSILHHAEIDTEVRAGYLKAAAASRRNGDEEDAALETNGDGTAAELTQEQFEEWRRSEEHTSELPSLMR